MSIISVNIDEAGYGKKIILNNLSFDVNENEIVALIGPNGAGKSTLLKAISGLLTALKGNIIYRENENITGINPEKLVKNGIVFVPQGNRVFTELTVMENFEIGGNLIKNSGDFKKKLDEVLQIFENLSDKLKQNAGKLSGGEKQQLALGMALMKSPELLLLDEPSLGLSHGMIIKAFDIIKKINQLYGTTIIIVEQKVKEVLAISTAVFALRNGEVVFKGTPEKILEGNTLQKIFVI